MLHVVQKLLFEILWYDGGETRQKEDTVHLELLQDQCECMGGKEGQVSV